MKPVDTQKLPMTTLERGTTFATADHADHWDAAAALVASYYNNRGIAEWQTLESWANATRMAATLGGVNPARLRAGVEQTCQAVEDVAVAGEHVKQNGATLDKELPGKIASIETDIDNIETTILELETSLAERRRDLLAVEGEAQRLADARSLVAAVEAEPVGSMRRAVWQIIKSGKHSFA